MRVTGLRHSPSPRIPYPASNNGSNNSQLFTNSACDALSAMIKPFHFLQDSRYALNKRHLLAAFGASSSVVLLMVAVYSDQALFDWQRWGITPLSLASLPCVLTAPLFHTSLIHLVANCLTMLVLGTLAGSVFPRATLLSIPFLWLGSGLAAWLLGHPGTLHYGADGITYGLLFLTATLGLVRLDIVAIITGLIAGGFYTAMMMTVLPATPQISWPSHLGGAVAGIIAGLLLQLVVPSQLQKNGRCHDE